MENNITKKDAFVLKFYLFSSKLTLYTFISFFILIIGVVIMGISLFIFDGYPLKYQFTDIKNNIMMICLMAPFILNSTILLIFGMGSAIASHTINNIFSKYEAQDSNINTEDLQTNPVDNTIYYASSLSNNELGKDIAGAKLTANAINISHKTCNKLDFFINNHGIKKYPNWGILLIIINIISALTLSATQIYDGIYSKNFILNSRQESFDLIKNAYKDIDNIKVEYSLGSKKKEAIRVEYNSDIHLYYTLDEYGKAEKIAIYYYNYINDDERTHLTGEELNDSIKLLYSKVKDYSSIFKDSEITQLNVSLPDETKKIYDSMNESSEEYKNEDIIKVNNDEIEKYIRISYDKSDHNKKMSKIEFYYTINNKTKINKRFYEK